MVSLLVRKGVRCWRQALACALLLLLYAQWRIMWRRSSPAQSPSRNRPLRPRPVYPIMHHHAQKNHGRPRWREAVVYTVAYLTKCDAKRLAALVATAGAGRDARQPRCKLTAGG